MQRSDKTSLFLKLLLLALAMVQLSCEGRSGGRSVLLIAVDRLPFTLSVCNRESVEISGFTELCRESIRFTHASTTSPLSVPALATLLTGMIPSEHGIRHNGWPGLSPIHRTFGEAALEKGYRTGFFSGGAPVWRRTGLHQGFENFDDSVIPQTTKLFRPFSETSRAFGQWLASDVGNDAFAAVIYVPDLAFVDTLTESSSGEARAFNDESQMDEFDEVLGRLIQELKKANRWNNTNVILTGLNGRSMGLRHDEIDPLVLNSENTQVTLLMKPVIKPRDEAINWKIDRNVSLADVGRTIFDLLGAPENHVGLFPAVSLRSALKSARPDWPEDRVIPIESAWASWQQWGLIRQGVVRGHDLVLDGDPPLVFNSLVDRFETAPQVADNHDREILDRWRDPSRPWVRLPQKRRMIFQIPSLSWLSTRESSDLQSRLSKMLDQKDPDERILKWSAQTALEHRNWALLAKAATKAKNPTWMAVADRNRGKKSSFQDDCLSLLDHGLHKTALAKNCDDASFLALIAWSRSEEDDDRREASRKRFLRAWEWHQLDLKILKANAGLDLIWKPASAEDKVPSPTSLALALPEMRRFNP